VLAGAQGELDGSAAAAAAARCASAKQRRWARCGPGAVLLALLALVLFAQALVFLEVLSAGSLRARGPGG
jgi:hypothetical protein